MKCFSKTEAPGLTSMVDKIGVLMIHHGLSLIISQHLSEETRDKFSPNLTIPMKWVKEIQGREQKQGKYANMFRCVEASLMTCC